MVLVYRINKRSQGSIYLPPLSSVQVLSDLGIMMSNEQFQELMARLNVTNGHMQYMDFIMNFGDPRPDSLDGPLGGVVHPANHKVNPIRGDEHGMTALEVESKLRQKLRENFTVRFGHGIPGLVLS